MVALLMASAVALLLALGLTPVLIRSFQMRGVGQQIREDGPQGHFTKAGTPTMGGVAIVGGAFAGYVVSNLYRGIYTRTVLVVMASILLSDLLYVLVDPRISFEKSEGIS